MLGLSSIKLEIFGKPVVLGNNVVIDNGEFNNTTGWDTMDGMTMNGVATMTTLEPYAFSNATETIVAGATYRCSVVLVSGGPKPSPFYIQIGGASYTIIPADAANGTYTVDGAANVADQMVGISGGTTGMVIDKLKIQRIMP